MPIKNLLIEKTEDNLNPELFAYSLFDFKLFFTEILGFELGEFREEIVKIFGRSRKVVLVLPRQHGKTTIILSFLLWKIIRGEPIKALIVANKLAQANANLNRIREMIRNSPYLAYGYVDEEELRKKGNSRVEEKMVFWNGSFIETKALNQNIRGGTYNFVFVDEIQNIKDKSLFYSVILPTTTSFKNKAYILCAGTPNSPHDLLSELKRNPEFEVFWRGIIWENKPLWKERFTMKDIKKLQETVPEATWRREFLCEVVPEHGSWIDSEIYYSAVDQKLGFKNDLPGFHIMGYDIATSTGENADYSVWVVMKVVEIDGIYHFYPVYFYRARGMTLIDQRNLTIQLAAKYNCLRIYVDAENIGRYFVDSLKKEGLPIVPIMIKGNSYKNVRNEILNLLRESIEANIIEKTSRKVPRLIIPANPDDEMAYNFYNTFTSEIFQLYQDVTPSGNVVIKTNEHDDTVMATGMALYGFMSGYGEFSIEIF